MTAIESRLRPFRVLVSEDDTEMRRLLVTYLRREGFEVAETGDCAYLLYCLGCPPDQRGDHPPPDLIISDNRMPGVTGLEILAGLRSAEWKTPFILITAFGDPETHAEAHRLGAVAVFDKPFNLQDLRRAVVAHLMPG